MPERNRLPGDAGGAGGGDRARAGARARDLGADGEGGGGGGAPGSLRRAGADAGGAHAAEAAGSAGAGGAAAAVGAELAPGGGAARGEPYDLAALQAGGAAAGDSRAGGGERRGGLPEAPATGERPPEAATGERPAEPASTPAERNRADRAAPLGMAASAVDERVAASAGGGTEPPRRFVAADSVARGGVLLALPALLQAGLLQAATALGSLPGYFGTETVLLLVAFLLLARVRSPEELRYEPPGEWGRLPGLDRCCHPDTLRRKLAALAADEDAVLAWARQLARRWCAELPLATLFFDGHVKVYTGSANLAWHFISRDQRTAPAAAAYWAHAPGGAPLLYLHKAG